MAESKGKGGAKTKTAINNTKTAVATANSNGKTIAIAILATILGCFVLMFVVLALTGVIKFGGTNSNTENTKVTTENGGGDTTGNGTTSTNGLIENPNKRVAVNGNLVEIDDLEFYLPKNFKAGDKTSDGAYTYNLVDDDGWAQVLVYAENSSLTSSKFLLEKSPYLDITDTDYEMNGTSWVQGETGSILAYATELDGKNYAVIYTVKLDSNTTSEAMSMIPKTLYMKRIHQK